MLKYSRTLKPNARRLRTNMTDAEQRLWFKLRRKQVLNIQFYRQKPIENYIVDFYAPAVKLVVEVDGGQHFDDEHQCRGEQRDACLKKMGLHVLRFDNLQVLQKTDAVVDSIFQVMEQRLKQ